MRPRGNFVTLDKSYRTVEDIRNVRRKELELERSRVENIMRILFFDKKINQEIIDSYNYFEAKWKLLNKYIIESEE